jgi:general secretion pathway protein D
MRVQLEVSNLIKEVSGPSGSLAYQVGTRLASTVLRLADGETQVLAGLINDEDRRRAIGVPGLSTLPVLGALFGVQSDSRAKTEVVLLITPRVVRNVAMPGYDGLVFDAGNDANPGALPLRLSAAAKTSVGLAAGGGGAAPASTGVAATAAPEGTLVLSSSGTTRVGETVSVTLRNESPWAARGELNFDAQFLQIASGEAADGGRLPFEMAARAEKVLVFRVLPAARGQSLNLTLGSVSAKRPDGSGVLLPVSGDAMVDVVVE